jgi:hypothetical protein
MTCLNDIHIQALADGEAAPEAARHAAGCARCGERLRERIELMGTIRRTIDLPVEVPRALADAVDGIFRLKAEATGNQAQATGNQGGATRLRQPHDLSESRGLRLSPRGFGLFPRSGGFRLFSRSGSFRLQAEGHHRWIYALGAAAATVVAVLFIAPALKSPDATVSASEILAKSASQLSAAVTGGVELLEYELVLDGVPKEMMSDGADGTYLVKQAIDHNVPGRFRFTSFGPDGGLMTSIAQDPGQNRRVMAFRVDEQPYRFEVSLPAKSAGMSLPEMERLHMEASIAMMQASGNQLVETIDGPHGKLFRIEVPHAAGPGTNPVWDLSEARVLIDARDYRVTELAVSGSFLKQAYSLSYKLISHSVVGSVPPDTFVVPAQAGQIVIRGEGSHLPSHDIVVLSLRELAKLKQARQ